MEPRDQEMGADSIKSPPPGFVLDEEVLKPPEGFILDEPISAPAEKPRTGVTGYFGPGPDEGQILRGFQKAVQGSSEAMAESAVSDKPSDIIKQAAKDWWGGIETPIGRLWAEEPNLFNTLTDTVLGMGAGVIGFFGSIAAQLAKLATTPVTEVYKPQALAEAKRFGEEVTNAITWDVKDPMAQTFLMAVSLAPTSVKAAFDMLADLAATPEGKAIVSDIQSYLPDAPLTDITPEDTTAAIGAALKAAGWVAELATWGAQFKAAKIKVKQPKKVEAKLPKGQLKLGIKEQLQRERRLEERAAKEAELHKKIAKKKPVTIQEKLALKLAERAPKEVAPGVVPEVGKARGREIGVWEEPLKEPTKAFEKYAANKVERYNKKNPDLDLRWEGYNTDLKAHQVTVYAGPLAGNTFHIPQKPTLKVIGEKIQALRPPAKAGEIAPEILAKLPPETQKILKESYIQEPPTVTLENLGLQTAYEKLTDFTRRVREGAKEKARAKIKEAKDACLEEIPGNALDRSAARYIKSESFQSYVGALPELGELKLGELKLDPKSGELFATYRTPKGVEKMAVRKSGFYAAKEFADEVKGFKDISRYSYEWTDIVRLIQEADQGKFAGPIQKHVLWPARLNVRAKFLWADTHKTKLGSIADKYRITSKGKARELGELLPHITTAELKIRVVELLQKPEIKKVVAKLSKKRASSLIECSKELRQWLDTLRDEQNAARRKMGRDEIGYITGYRPDVIKTNLWARIGFGDSKPIEVVNTPGLPDFIRPNQPFVAHAQARKFLLKRYPKETNAIRLLGDYVDAAAKDIFDTATIHHLKIHAAVLKPKMPHAAYALERWAGEVFAGAGHWLTKGARRVLPVPLRRAYMGLRRGLTRAVFPLNWTWNAFIQTSSAGITYMRYGNRANVAGLRYITSPTTRKIIQENAYSVIVKKRVGGKLAYQDLRQSIMKNRRLQGTIMDSIDTYLNFLTNSMEDSLTGHAVAAALYDGKTRLKLKGRELYEYAAEGGAKTQSMYDPIFQPGLLRAREVGAAFPFQTFAFEVFNTVREMNIVAARRVVGKTGIYETMSAKSALGKATISRRMRAIGRFAVAIMITNAIAEANLGRKAWRGPSSFIPFINYVLLGEWERGPLPVQYVQEFKKAYQGYLKYGDWTKLRRWVLRYHAPAGFQLERVIEGIETIADEGVVRDVTGRALFRVPEEEYPAAVLRGPYATPTGREYLREKKKPKETKTLRKVRRKIE